uniref:HAT C-terminal dimerisation domain-containing protein n=1 Tax=Strongyloides stercoralis TaxID=6248 RepID=A0A0K0EJ22_STRER
MTESEWDASINLVGMDYKEMVKDNIMENTQKIKRQTGFERFIQRLKCVDNTSSLFNSSSTDEKELIKKYLILCSFVKSEQTFSITKYCYNDYRESMKFSTLKAEVVLKSNIDLI